MREKKNLHLTSLVEGNFFGEYEIVRKMKHRIYCAIVESPRLELLRISVSNLKIMSNLHDVMDRLRSYCEMKEDWRLDYANRS